jgi:endoglucanase
MRYTSKKKLIKFKFYKQLLIFTLALVVFFGGIITKLPIQSQASLASNGMTMQLPLSTRGAKIVDAKGKVVRLFGVNWFGMETEIHAPHGLWKRDYKEMLAQLKSLGYNLIRLPYSVQALGSTTVSGIDFNIGSNKELEGKTPLELMDLIVAEAERQGILIILDSHRLNDERIPELWYGDGFSEADWIDTWKMLAIRYKNQANIIGADLKNEPHGIASWGTNQRLTDWRLAAEKAGNAILDINPNWLIIVEGVEKNVPGQKLKKHWWGGNLEGVRRFPVRLSRRHKLVYSPHEYGSGVFDAPHFSEKTFPKNLSDRWQTGFYYISSQNIAPILIGEFGGRQVDTNSKEGIWQNEFVKYIKKNNLSFTYWSWNPNSHDTGGILLDDWQNIDVPKQQLLSQLLPIKFTPVEGQGGNLTASPRLPLSMSSSTAQLKLTTDIYSNWDKGFCVSFKIANQGSNKVTDWQLAFNMKQAEIYNSWSANFKQKGATQYVVTPLDWGRLIEPNKIRDIGFCANKRGNEYQPTEVKLES